MQQEGDSHVLGSVRPVALMRRCSHSRPPVSARDFISCFTGKVEAIEGERRPPAGPQPVLCLLLTPCRGPRLLPGELSPPGLERMPLVFSGCCYCPSLCFSAWLPSAWLLRVAPRGCSFSLFCLFLPPFVSAQMLSPFTGKHIPFRLLAPSLH